MPQEHAEPAAAAGQQDPLTLLREVRTRLSNIYHDANNPLAIISGNAQYLVELSDAMELDDELVQPIHDIDEASRRVATKLRDLARLKEEIATYLSECGDAEEHT